jgi:acyl-[acyl-carrier-protein]-phospholipid O-acyltransferase/long-chain-fatty-acid--[acyl-carrier-protein] ligase
MILAGALIAAVLLIYGATAVHAMVSLGLSGRQAALYAPLKLLYRVSDRPIAAARKADAPVIYVVTHQSRLDPALMLALLPEDTLHILDPESAVSPWLEPFRSLARTITFNTEHVFVSRRLVRVLKGKGRLAVYIPDVVEPDPRAFRLYRAVARIALQANAAVVPIYIDGAKLLPSSLDQSRAKPRRRLPRLTMTALPALTVPQLIAASGSPSASNANALFDRVAEARVEAKTRAPSLFAAVRDAALRLGPHRVIVEDVVTGAMDYRRLLIATRIFAGRFARQTAPDEVVGVLLPNANGAAITLLGLNSAGRTAAMLNYSAGPATIGAAVTTGLIRRIVTSRAFVEKAALGDLVTAAEAAGARMVWLEDLRTGITGFDKMLGAILWRRPVSPQKPDSAAVIMFTSGSEGQPKAVVLSQRNLITNAMQVESRLDIGPADRVMNVLPVFHGFGLTGGLILPLLTGVKVLLYPSPLHYRQVPKAAAAFRPTFMLGTDTFLAAYAHSAQEGDFMGVRFAVAGAEPVRAETRRLWMDRFGVRILEGYGMTEASPVAALNTTTHGREGTVGRPLPGIRVRLEPVEGIVDAARLMISGPNVMMGTISADRPGDVQALTSGWHDSGDIVAIDREGFITIRGRAKRFAKIAGEMVSLGAVERLADGVWPEGRHAAATVPDKRRGERIVLMTTTKGAELSMLRQHARKEGTAELWVPDMIIEVDEIPVTASGKTDHVSVNRIVRERFGHPAAA